MKKEDKAAKKHRIILHLSDLHMRQNCKLSNEQQMRIAFLDKLRIIANESDIIGLLITGDLADAGRKSDYAAATELLEKIIDEICISKENIIIIPGNHDISRDRYSVCLDDNTAPNESLMRKAKLENYTKFHNDFYADCIKSGVVKNMSSDKIIYQGPYKLNFLKKVEFIWINSNYSRDASDNYTNLPLEQFGRELDEIIPTEKSNFTIGIIHEIGDWSGAYFQEFWRALNSHDITSLICGHIHASVTSDRRENYIEMRSQTGRQLQKSQFCNDIENEGFLYYEVEEDEEYLQLKVCEYFYQDSTVNCPQFIKRDASDQDYFVFCGTKPPVLKADAQPDKSTPLDNISSNLELEQEGANETSAVKRSDLINRMLIENRVYLTGHFHFGNKKRTHLFINLAGVLGIISWRKRLCDALTMEIRKVQTSYGLTEFNAIIGYGMQGIIIGAHLSTTAEFQDAVFTYFPHPERKHSVKEHSTTIDTPRSVIIVTDVISSGQSILRLIDANREMFRETQEILVASVIHKVSSNNGSEIKINESYFEERMKTENYKHLKILYITLGIVNDIPCTFKDNSERCPVYLEHLSEVSILYDEQ